MKDWIRSFEVPPYYHRIKLVVTNDMKKWCERYPDADGTDDTCQAFVAVEKPSEPKHQIIVIEPKTPLNTISHEIGHAARYIMDYIGFTIKADNDEPLAYLEDWLTKKIHDICNKIPVDKPENSVTVDNAPEITPVLNKDPDWANIPCKKLISLSAENPPDN